MKTLKISIRIGLVIMLGMGFTNHLSAQSKQKSNPEIVQLKSALDSIAKVNAVVASHLQKFDTLDFVVFTNEEWTRLHESHDKNIIVHWPDGHTTTGIEKHIEDLAAMFVYAPDTRIQEHPIKIGSGNLTAVMGVIEGTFTEPMPIGNGQFIQPTGKAYKLNMVTIGIWNDEGVMIEEYLFWDNLTFMKQLGLQ